MWSFVLTCVKICGIILALIDNVVKNMLAKERQDTIKKLIEQNGAVKTSNLVEKFNVSVETIRRDFLDLEKAGVLTKVHGGAIAISPMKPFFSFEQRKEDFFEEKIELCDFACSLISEGDIIGIDTGTTGIVFANALKGKFKNLTIITYSLDIFNILSKNEGFTVILCGGNFDRDENSFYGSLAIDMLSSLHIQKAFIFPSAVSLDFGIGVYQEHLLLIQKKLMEISNEVYILADSSKFEKKALIRLEALKNDYTFVTDSAFSNEIKNLYIENGINVINGAK